MHRRFSDGVHQNPDIKFIITRELLFILITVQPDLYSASTEHRCILYRQAWLKKTYRTGRHGAKAVIWHDDAYTGSAASHIATITK